MKILYDTARRAGKTYNLILEAFASQGVIVVGTAQEVEHVTRCAATPIHVHQASAWQLFAGLRGPFLFDNVDHIFQTLLGIVPTVVTVGEPSQAVNLTSKLDPGIQDVVHWLQSHGFKTTDSGDGETKFKENPDTDALTVPHVFMSVENPNHLHSESRRLADLLSRIGIYILPQGCDGVSIQAGFDPADNTAIIGLFGLNDNELHNAFQDTAKRLEQLEASISEYILSGTGSLTETKNVLDSLADAVVKRGFPREKAGVLEAQLCQLHGPEHVRALDAYWETSLYALGLISEEQ